MQREYDVVIEKGNQFYFGFCPQVPGANGQGETLEACKESIKAAIELILEFRLEEAMKETSTDAIHETVVIG